ncbi:unnamed protein product [Dovyalis caffra]|uniref:Uncharacterized protein n=1 Tax=Dovyalis caffra TaxID=77055 RepID=A0AAV1SC99_9ROSI|nr:unnamed protein product [Dovyalis caffra]
MLAWRKIHCAEREDLPCLAQHKQIISRNSISNQPIIGLTNISISIPNIEANSNSDRDTYKKPSCDKCFKLVCDPKPPSKAPPPMRQAGRFHREKHFLLTSHITRAALD